MRLLGSETGPKTWKLDFNLACDFDPEGPRTCRPPESGTEGVGGEREVGRGMVSGGCSVVTSKRKDRKGGKKHRKNKNWNKQKKGVRWSSTLWVSFWDVFGGSNKN